MTLLQIILLLIGDMPLYDAVIMTFGSAGTGGFSSLNDSAASYTPYQQGVITVFMMLFGMNFAFYFLILQKKFKRALFLEEIRYYIIIMVVAVLIITLNTRGMYESLYAAFHHASFQVSSIMTTTGFSTVDFDMWPELSKTILVLLMFVGACAGSTGGGIKVSRVVMLVKTVRKELRCYLHPHSVSKVSMDKKVIPHEVLRKTNVFLVVYLLIFVVSVLVVSLDNFNAITNFTAVAATLNNIGPGLAAVGPTQNFAEYSILSKFVLMFDMLAGRLELFPLLLLFKREVWKKF